MRTLAGSICVILSLGCIGLFANWIWHLARNGWSRVAPNIARMPLDSSIGIMVGVVGALLLLAGAALLLTPRR